MGIEFEADGKSYYNLPHNNLYKKLSYIENYDSNDQTFLYFDNYSHPPDLSSHKNIKKETYNIKVALWQIPYEHPFSKICKRYDSDNNSWLEYRNNYNENEIEEAEKGVGSKLNHYKVATKNTYYDDGTRDIISKYPNGTIITEHRGDNSVFINIKDKNNRTLAEKVYSYDTNEGRKTVFQNIENDNNIFSIVKVYSYDTRHNRETDVVNFGYTNSTSTLTNGCHLEKEYYMLNGEEVDAECKKGGKYKVKDKNGKKFKFKAE